jgi:type IV pilus assembly protein PilE
MGAKKSGGFTLIEAMIVVAVIAIIAAIALPSYQDSVRKSRRADATAELERLAARQERWFTENNSYTNVLANLTGGATTTPEGHYNLTMTHPGGCGTSCFLITATAAGGQSSDTKCTSFSLNEIGARTFGGSGTSRDCW